LHLYAAIAELAARKLRPGKLCLAYCGKMFLPRGLEDMGRHLRYWWLFAVTFRVRRQTGVLRRRIEEGYRPVVAFCRRPLGPAPDWPADLLPGSVLLAGTYPGERFSFCSCNEGVAPWLSSPCSVG